MPAYFIPLHPGMRAAHGLHPRFRICANFQIL